MSDAEIRRNVWDRAVNTWRRLVDTATIAWDTSAPGVASAGVPDGGITLAKFATDVYEIGTWEPTLTFATPGDLSVVYSVRLGSFTKVGRLVTAHFAVVTSTFTHSTASGACRITGLPFAAAGAFSQRGFLHFQGITKANYTQFTVRVGNGATLMTVEASGSGQAESDVAAADMPTAGVVILAGTIIYTA